MSAKRGPRATPAATNGPLTFYFVGAAAREFRQSPKTVRRLIDQGLIPARRLGGHIVLLKSDLDRFFRELPVVVSVDHALARIVAQAQAHGEAVADVERES
jgi:excisionase family DNA binding protein